MAHTVTLKHAVFKFSVSNGVEARRRISKKSSAPQKTLEVFAAAYAKWLNQSRCICGANICGFKETYEIGSRLDESIYHWDG